MQLQELKKAYDACRLSKKSYEQLLEERENLHQSLIRLKEKTEAAIYSQKKVPKELDTLIELQEELKSLDHQLDLMDQCDDEKLGDLRESIIAEIHSAFPGSESSYDQLYKRLLGWREESAKWSHELEQLQPFQAAINEGIAVKKRNGVIGFLFGGSAKAGLARTIRKAIIEAERVYSQVEEVSIRHFLDTFLEEANRPWNNDLYRKRFYELHKEFNDLLESLGEKITQSRRQALIAEKEIESWIESYCKK